MLAIRRRQRGRQSARASSRCVRARSRLSPFHLAGTRDRCSTDAAAVRAARERVYKRRQSPARIISCTRRRLRSAPLSIVTAAASPRAAADMQKFLVVAAIVALFVVANIDARPQADFTGTGSILESHGGQLGSYSSNELNGYSQGFFPGNTQPLFGDGLFGRRRRRSVRRTRFA